MGTTNLIVLAVRWSVKYFSCSKFLTFQKSLDDRRKQIARQLQNVMFYRQMQKEYKILFTKCIDISGNSSTAKAVSCKIY